MADRTRDADFAAYMQARQPALLRTAFLLTGDRHIAEDVVATALAKLYLSWDKVRERDSVDGYVRRIIANETTSLWRRPWRRREVVADVLPERSREETYDDGRADAVWRAVTSLPTRQRAVVVLRYYEELSEAEIADVLGISTGTVKSQASRALATLRATHPDLASGLEER
ncbi:RNA polymerase sigma-70 factor, sigma-E family [Nocardioides terrae]|uniref:RNA polymerase sigma-70 factor, sigma-E family n=1 Tax=Nocardioides terrae TaxID=574651 RepID=A0A1I1LFB7_9ACTN|nr:SigE family RNA polymerase sigma factor [Nocardioides terrae]SFC71685.1 RNA polymerase sigma-70 factor, sigma-E family [Nocardioides terrae]